MVRIDTGMGKLGELLRLGIIIRASISKGVQGYAFIEISGDLQQAIIPGLLYAGGHLRFRAGVFDNGDTQLELTAGTVGSIGGDLIKGLIEVGKGPRSTATPWWFRTTAWGSPAGRGDGDGSARHAAERPVRD